MESRPPGSWRGRYSGPTVNQAKTMKHLTSAMGAAVAAWCLSGFGSEPLDTWQWRNPIPGGNVPYAITYADGTFAAVGYGGAVASSQDGTNWVSRNIGPLYGAEATYALDGIAWGNGLWVAVGTGQYSPGDNFEVIITSSNLVTWTPQTAPQDVFINLCSVIYADGLFVAVGWGFDPQSSMSFPGIRTSPDGVHWTRQIVTASDPDLMPDLREIAYGNGVFVGVTINGSIYTSPDATNWTGQTSGNSFLYGLTYGNGLFLVDSSPQGVLASTDGVTWAERAPYIGACHLTYGNGLFVAAGGNGQIKTSPDGINWTTRNSGTTNGLSAIAFGNGTFVAVGTGALVVSPNGSNWVSLASAVTTTTLNDITYGHGSFVAVGYGGARLHSADGAHWSLSASGPSGLFDLLAVAFGDGRFVAVGNQGTILVSTNGNNWAIATNAGTALLLDVGYGDGRFVAIGASGVMLTSTDSISWTVQDPGVAMDFWSIAYGNGVFVIGASTGTLTSRDSAAWTVHDLNVAAARITGLAFGKGLFVAPGGRGLILTSTNGADWATSSSGTSADLYSVAYGGGTFLVTGSGGALLTSTDGTNWVSRDVSTMMHLRSATFGQDTFVAVGDAGAILQSGVMPPVNARLSPFPGWSNGAFGLSLTAPPGSSWELQACTDLQTWSALGTLSITNGPVQFFDGAATGFTQRFYRAVAR